MIVTIDLNIVLDVYLLRGDYDSAMTVLSACKSRKLDGYMPSHAAPTIFYILNKNLAE